MSPKRDIIQRCKENSAILNLSQVVRQIKSAFQTVKKVHQDIQVYGQAQAYKYTFLKQPAELERLDRSIVEARDGFLTIADLKRRNQSCSRRLIGKRLKESGLRYRLMPKNHKLEQPYNYNSA